MLIALLLIGVLALSIWFKHRRFVANDATRQQQLTTLARAEEFYFDRFHRYGELSELVSARLLTELPHDPTSLQPYQVYFSSPQDEWCAWAKLEATPNSYLIQTEHASRFSAQPPDSIASCMNP